MPQFCLRLALEYATERGWHVFPVPVGTKKSHKKAAYSGGRNWGMTNDPAEIRRDFTQWPDAGIGIPTGADNKIWITEADTMEGHGVDGIAGMKALEAKHGPLPATLQAISPSGSIHWYWRYPDDGTVITSSSSAIATGVDVKGEGGMVVGPPTIKPGKGAYRWLNDLPVAPAPDWLLELVRKEERAAAYNAAGESRADIASLTLAMAMIPNDGVSWDEWNRIAMALFAATGGSEDGFKLFDAWSQRSSKYDADVTINKWGKIKGCPPREIGAGSIFFMAEESVPGWQRRIFGDPEVDALLREFHLLLGEPA